MVFAGPLPGAMAFMCSSCEPIFAPRLGTLPYTTPLHHEPHIITHHRCASRHDEQRSLSLQRVQALKQGGPLNSQTCMFDIHTRQPGASIHPSLCMQQARGATASYKHLNQQMSSIHGASMQCSRGMMRGPSPGRLLGHACTFRAGAVATAQGWGHQPPGPADSSCVGSHRSR
mgnify:CR=1 FL=1